MVNVKPVQLGKNVRMSFSRIGEVLEMPNLIEVQKNSYQWFLNEGLKEVFHDVSPITDYQAIWCWISSTTASMTPPSTPSPSARSGTPPTPPPLRVRASLLNRETGEVKGAGHLHGRLPADDRQRHLRHQRGRAGSSSPSLVRSPGVYYSAARDKTGKELFASTVIPNRGAWLEYETDSNDVVLCAHRQKPQAADHHLHPGAGRRHR